MSYFGGVESNILYFQFQESMNMTDLKYHSRHLRQNFLYSEDVNKNPAWLFVLPFLNVFLIYQYHYLPKKKIFWAKKQRFDHVTFAMRSFWANKFRKLSMLSEEKNPKP